MEIEYAEQYLNKLEMLPTKSLIKKIIKLKPLEKCDFYLTSETIKSNDGEKQAKIVHIYPKFSTYLRASSSILKLPLIILTFNFKRLLLLESFTSFF